MSLVDRFFMLLLQAAVEDALGCHCDQAEALGRVLCDLNLVLHIEVLVVVRSALNQLI